MENQDYNGNKRLYKDTDFQENEQVFKDNSKLFIKAFEDAETKNSEQSFFVVKTASEWLKIANSRPIPKMLFGEFWFQGEICILFADTNLGKSILAVQIANSISNAERVIPFKIEAKKQSVLYFDFELSDKQFENRYSDNYENHFQFESNFIRVELNSEYEIPEETNFEDYLFASIEKLIIKREIKVLIIDNLTYLKNETEKARNALPLMKQLKALKNKYELSILVLAHTPKRDLSKPITRNDLQGSKMLINFCDSAFSIGESYQDKSLRYLKQIKARNTEIIYDSENVPIFQIEKEYNFLKFSFFEYNTEQEHLRQQSENEIDVLNQNIIELKKSNPNLNNSEIAKQLNTNRMKVKRILDKQSL